MTTVYYRGDKVYQTLEELWQAAIAEERERCARIAEDACYCGGKAGCEGCWAAEEIRKPQERK